jgi:hypothetical protein
VRAEDSARPRNVNIGEGKQLIGRIRPIRPIR